MIDWQFHNDAMSGNDGRMPPRLVAPTINDLAELDAYEKAYRADHGRWTDHDLKAIEARRKELNRRERLK